MSKKSMMIAGAVVLVVILGVGLYLSSRQTPIRILGITWNPSATTASSGTGGTTTQTAAGLSTGSNAGNTGGTSAAGGTSAGSGASGSGTNGGASGSGGSASGSNSSLPPLKPFPRMPSPTIPAETLSSPAAPGKALPPLIAAPEPTISGILQSAVPDGSQYTVTMRPYGFGPTSLFGTGMAIRVDSARPVGKAPAYGDLANANLLVVVDTGGGGAVTQGGTYSAILTLRSDGTKLLPIMSAAKASD